MDAHTLAPDADRNLAAAWELLGRNAGFPVEQVGSLTLMASGLPIPFFNGAFAVGASADPALAVAEVLAFFERADVPFLVWVRDGADDALLAAGRAAGLRDAGGPPLMVLPEIVSVPPPPAEIDVAIARDDADLDAHRAVVAAAFGMPLDVARAVVGGSVIEDPDLAVAVGRVDAVPVATALLARSGATAGVYNVATLAAHRGKGYGEAVTWAVIAEGARRGCTHSVLQSSDAGHPVYLRMGFVDVGRYVQLQGPPA